MLISNGFELKNVKDTSNKLFGRLGMLSYNLGFWNKLKLIEVKLKSSETLNFENLSVLQNT